MNRRRVIGGVGAALLTGNFSEAASADYNALISGQYANNLILQQVGGLYFQKDLTLGPSQYPWRLTLGQYNWMNDGHLTIFTGYWVFRTDAHQCWQAANDGGGGLDFWNQDGKAMGPPQDWELFNFEAANAAQGTVRIKHKNNSYIGLFGNNFTCSAGLSNAAVFNPVFSS